MSEKQENSELQGSDLLQELTSTDTCTDGYDAICEALKKIYGEQEGQYHRALIPYCLGGDSPLDGVEVYLCKQERAHWHYITYGFSDLFENENPDSELSGYGFELTFRLLKGEEDTAPNWPINFLQNLARYVFESGNPFDAGHHMDANSPIALEEETELTAMGFGLDPVLGQIDTPNGKVKFLQVNALTHDEMMAMMCAQGDKFIEQTHKYLPLGICELSRTSLMENADFVEAWERSVELEGSSTGFLYLDRMSLKQENGGITISLTYSYIQLIGTMIGARLLKDRHLLLVSPDCVIDLLLGDFSLNKEEDDYYKLELAKAEYESIFEQIGQYLKAGASSPTSFKAPNSPVVIELIA